MNRISKHALSLVLLLLCVAMGTTVAQGKTKAKSKSRTIYYIVCGSYSSLQEASNFAEQMSEVVFYEVFEAKANGKTVYRVCCDCYYNLDDAKKDLRGIYSNFGSDDWWIWPSKGLAKCVYRPASPRDGKPIPVFQPRRTAFD